MTSISSAEVPLHPIERAVILSLSKPSEGKWLSLEDVAATSSLSLDQVRRAVEWLREKKFIELHDDVVKYIRLGEGGRKALDSGLPERRIVRILQKRGGRSPIPEVARELRDEFSVALGRARQNEWLEINGNVLILTSESDQKESEEEFLERLGSIGRVRLADLSPDENVTVAVLSKRRRDFLREEDEKNVSVRLTAAGRALAQEASREEINEITTDVLLSGKWRSVPIREIDVTSPTPIIFPGRRHPLRIFIDEVRETFVSLGFEEIVGNLTQSAFWNFDALFIPQEHPARDLQDTFYVRGIEADLAQYADEVREVSRVHKMGGDTGSLGWNYEWSAERARRIVLRTHTTAVTISYLAKTRPAEARVFTVSRVFRNEKPTYKNNPEFYQVDGVAVGRDMNVRSLIYVISRFYAKLGFPKIKFWPTYFPYTEPSLQTMVYYLKMKKWIELGGMGVFRPEVCIPLGIKTPVLAWGLGLDRLVMLKYGLKDIRELFGGNLHWLRNIKIT